MTSALTNQRQVFKACLKQKEQVSDDVARNIGPLDFILGTYLRKVYSVITYTNLILSKPKGFIGGNLKAALPPVPKPLPIFEFALPVDPEFWFQSYWQLPKLHLSLNPEQSLSKLHWFVFGETQL